LDPRPPGFLVHDPTSIQPRVRCLMHDRGSQLLRSGVGICDVSLVDYAGIDRSVVLGGGVGKQVNPDALKVAEDAGILQRTVPLDQVQRLFDPGQVLWLPITSNPKTVDMASR